MGRSLAAFALASALALFTSRARANGRYPTAGQLVVAPANADHLYVRTTFGILVSKDRGATWDWICETAYGDSTNYDATMGVTAAETLLMTLPNGLWESTDGCNWSRSAGIGVHAVTDVVVRREDPSSALVVTSDYAGVDGGVSIFDSRVYSTADDGVTWSAVGAPIQPPVLIATIEVAASDDQRIYVSGARATTTTTDEMIIASADDGATWTEHDVAPVPGDLGVYLAAVDPSNADVVYARTQNVTAGTTTGRLLVSTDGAQSFQSAYAGGALLGFALSPDGGEVYVGGLWPSDGLRASPSGTLSFTQRATFSVECLGTSGSLLYACGDNFTGFPLGVSSDDGVTFARALDFRAIRGPLSCPAGSATASCAAQWPALEAQLGIAMDGGGGGNDGSDGADGTDGGGDEADASASPDANANANADASANANAAPARRSGSCGCAVGPRGGGGAAIALALGALYAFGRRRRR